MPDDSNKRKVIGDPHIAGALFTLDMKIKKGTGVSKILHEKSKKIIGNVILPGMDGNLYKQDYQANAVFQKDEIIEKYLFRSSDNRVSQGGGSRYMGIFVLEKTNLDETLVQQRIHHDRNHDLFYNRQQNSCGHHAERAFVGKEIGDKNLETQTAFVNIALQVTERMDSKFTDHLKEIVYQSGLYKTAVQLGEEDHMIQKQKVEKPSFKL